MNDVTYTRPAGPVPVGVDTWRLLALALLPVRFLQGFIYWGGGSRRFIYAPAKLDPDAPHWMANKFQSAMPGAILGTDHIIAWLLQHFAALYTGLIVFSALELLCGLGLIAGFLTRLSALGTVGFSIVLMLMFGWQGATCIDEWTMAACNLAMGATLMFAGAGAFSLDNLLLARFPGLADRGWFRWACGSLPLPISAATFLKLSLAVFAATAIFNVGTYNYYRGSVVTPYHEGPTSPSKHHFSLTDLRVSPDGAVRFHIALDAGTPEAPAHVMEAALLDGSGRELRRWDTAQLSRVPANFVVNDFAYNRFETGRFGLNAEMGASAVITLPSGQMIGNVVRPLRLEIVDVEGRTFFVTS